MKKRLERARQLRVARQQRNGVRRTHHYGFNNNLALAAIGMCFLASIMMAATSFTGHVAGVDGGSVVESYGSGVMFFLLGMWGLFMLVWTHRTPDR